MAAQTDKEQRMTSRYRHVSVQVPATTANLGSGFDTMGLALNFHDELSFTAHDDPADHGVDVSIEGEGADTLPRDETHLVVSSFRKACRTLGLGRVGLSLHARNRIPQARGMGSSAEAIVAGITAAMAMVQGDPDRQAIFDMAATIEGHPDNVAPAVFGGLTTSWRLDLPEGQGSMTIPGSEPLSRGFHVARYAVDPAITVSVFVPDFELSTERAREALPDAVPYADAVFNLSRAALLPAALNPGLAGAGDDPNALLFAATQDRLHQPYRRGLMPESWRLIETLRSRGFAAAVSGAGPCVLVLHYGRAQDVIDHEAREQLDSGRWRVLHLPIDHRGVAIDVA
ncbi:homoserine kinase [Bifidobacterium mongoliense DSM 21395]|uniref:Homoserine kinase n=2 Tax=Bifidobacterium mongoliense TaxID=518643 RepID=A0A087C0B7_9BIFI|nr:homoserine kinase [Bifidobacterium mongoliense DSM 21395]